MYKNLLQQYSEVIKERNDLEKRIERIKKKSEIASDTVQKGVKHYIAIVGYDVKRKLLIDRYEKLLNNAYLKVDEIKVKIEEFIQTIEDSATRQIFRYKYIDEKNWVQIMFLMNYNTIDKARKKHDRFLEKN